MRPAKATSQIFVAVEAFFSATAELTAYRKPAKEKVTEYLQTQLGKNEPASLDSPQPVCDLVRIAVPQLEVWFFLQFLLEACLTLYPIALRARPNLRGELWSPAVAR